MASRREERERPPEDEGPPREPFGQWLADTLEEIRDEAERHFPAAIIAQVLQYCVDSTGSEEEGCMKAITLLNRALFIHLPQCPSYIRIRSGSGNVNPRPATRPRPGQGDIRRGLQE
uniref:Vpr protein n=1 Tax=Simian immunodeficiency virus TaxID=11723 RepID=F4N9P9_SIV|nr:Vpr protein [Simian immunodeficiency virus]